jgi:hypothetical protein
MITRRRMMVAGTGSLAALVTAGHAAAEEPTISTQRRNGTVEIKRSRSQPSRKAPPEYFTGAVRVDPLFQAPDPARVSGSSVTFEPGARTAWEKGSKQVDVVDVQPAAAAREQIAAWSCAAGRRSSGLVPGSRRFARPCT